MSLLKQYSCESEVGQLVAGGIRTVEDLVLTSDCMLAELGLKKGTRLKIGKWQREMRVAGVKSVSQKRSASRAEEEEDDLSDSEDFLVTIPQPSRRTNCATSCSCKLAFGWRIA